MNRSLLFAVAIFVAAIGFTLFWLRPVEHREKPERERHRDEPTPTAAPSTPVAQNAQLVNPIAANTEPVVNAPDTPQQQKFLELFETPISFFGRVLDERGNPVPAATATIRAADKAGDNGSKHERISDENGFFEITGIRGAELYVEVMKDGYHQTDASRENFRYAGPPSTDAGAIPSKESPATFVLKQKGAPASLIHISERPIKAPGNGTAVEISLRTGRTVTAGQGDLKVELWAEEAQRDNEGRYPWRSRVTVPGGGLTERRDPYQFEAPAEGYSPFAELQPSPERWSSRIEKQYFVALRDGCFARIELRLRAEGEHYFVVESFLNPQPGSRNLEYDRSLKITSPKQP